MANDYPIGVVVQASTGASAGDVVYMTDGLFRVNTQLQELDANPSPDFIDKIKRALGYLEKPLVKCRHCGQWGAAY